MLLPEPRLTTANGIRPHRRRSKSTQPTLLPILVIINARFKGWLSRLDSILRSNETIAAVPVLPVRFLLSGCRLAAVAAYNDLDVPPSCNIVDQVLVWQWEAGPATDPSRESKYSDLVIAVVRLCSVKSSALPVRWQAEARIPSFGCFD